MPTDQSLQHIREASAHVEQTAFAIPELYPDFKAFVGIPTADERDAIKFPYSYRIWGQTKFGPPPGEAQGEPQQRRGPSDGGASPRWRVHTLLVPLPVGERADPRGLTWLEKEAANKWVDPFDDLYRANSMLPDAEGHASCVQARVLRAKPLLDNLLGEPHYGVLFTVEVRARPLVRTAALG